MNFNSPYRGLKPTCVKNFTTQHNRQRSNSNSLARKPTFKVTERVK